MSSAVERRFPETGFGRPGREEPDSSREGEFPGGAKNGCCWANFYLFSLRISKFSKQL
jgi:hypothetical protein